MVWRLREGIGLHRMPFGGAFVVDDTQLAARQISSELTNLLAGTATPLADPSSALAAELRLGVHDGWLVHVEENA